MQGDVRYSLHSEVALSELFVDWRYLEGGSGSRYFLEKIGGCRKKLIVTSLRKWWEME